MSVLALYAGDFGEAVAARIVSACNAITVPLTASYDVLESAIASCDYVAVATWRPYIDQCRWLDDICHRHGRRWSMVEVVETALECGPLVLPGAGTGCYHCYLARTDAPRREGDRRRVLRQAYARDPQLGPHGHTPPMVAIGAASLLHDWTSTTPGRFRHIDVLNGSVMESELIPLHECPRCRPQAMGYQPTRRYVDSMLDELNRLT